MHKFSELVKFKTDLAASIEHLQIDSAVYEKVQKLIMVQKLNPNISYNNQIDEYIQGFLDLIQLNKQSILKIEESVSSIQIEIDQLAKTLFDSEDQKSRFLPNNICQVLTLDKECTEYITTRIGSYCDWKYPGLVLYPREKKWIDAVVATDPLYLVQHSSIDLTALIEEFDEAYINRLRCYSIDKFSALPKQQFRFILLWDFLNYISVDRFDYYFRNAFELLKPGGTLMVSYNNCDIEGSANLAEIDASSYANIRIVKNLAKKIGFNVSRVEDLPTGDALVTHVSWVELRKPGVLTTVKAHQALAQILGK